MSSRAQCHGRQACKRRSVIAASTRSTALEPAGSLGVRGDGIVDPTPRTVTTPTTPEQKGSASASATAQAASGFTFPGPGTSYAEPGSVDVGWDPGSTTATKWRLTERAGAVDADGGCRGTRYAAVATRTTSATSMRVSNLRPDRCYRFAVAAIAGGGTHPPAFESGDLRVLEPWSGHFDLYRPGVFTTQKTWTWCIGASVQIMLNIQRGQADHSRTGQKRYITYARGQDLYSPGQARGSDALGWAAALNHYGGETDYHPAASATFEAAVLDAAVEMRRTSRPVGLITTHGVDGHAWVLTGFAATADPAVDAGAVITEVYVTGPLYPMQQVDGFDMPPDTALSFDDLRGYLLPYHDTALPDNPWEGAYLTVVP